MAIYTVAVRGGWAEFRWKDADVHTDVLPNNELRVLHAGVGFPHLMLISVKTDCGTKSYVGPVFSYHELIRNQRLTDQDWMGELLLRDPTPWPWDWRIPDSEPPVPAWVEEFRG